jgi:hypothetical protein
MGELTDIAGPRPTPADRSMGTTVRTDVTSPEVRTTVPQTGLPRVQSSPVVLSTQERQALASNVESDATNMLNERLGELSNFIRQKAENMSNEDVALIGSTLEQAREASRNPAANRSTINTAFSGNSIASVFQMHPQLKADDPFFFNPLFERGMRVHDEVQSVVELMSVPRFRDPETNEVRNVDDAVKLEFIQRLINDPTIPNYAIPITLWEEYVRAKRNITQSNVTESGRGYDTFTQPLAP